MTILLPSVPKRLNVRFPIVDEGLFGAALFGEEHVESTFGNLFPFLPRLRLPRIESIQAAPFKKEPK